jgi:HSP90 family molecular chaperone
MWALQTDKICSKIRSLFVIRRLSTITELDLLITVYYKTVYPHFSTVFRYGCHVTKKNKEFSNNKNGQLSISQD